MFASYCAMRQTDIAWLAGVFDADGSISRGVRRATGKATWAFRIAMNCQETVLRCSNILNEAGISHTRREYVPNTPTGPTRAGVAYSVESTRVESLQRLCKLLTPYSTTKKNKMIECSMELAGARKLTNHRSVRQEDWSNT